MSPINPVLARKLGRRDQAEQQASAVQDATPTRLMRLALMRAADKSLGLSLNMLGIEVNDRAPELLVEEGPQDWLIIGLCETETPGLAGIVLIDGVLRSALIEMQTMGVLLKEGATDRAVTATDAALAAPFVDQLLDEIRGSGAAGLMPPALVEMRHIADMRAAGLAMREGEYSCCQISMQIGGTERQGEMLLAFAGNPARAIAPVDGAEAPSDWSRDLRAAVGGAKATIEAVLCRMQVPISQIDGLEVGQVVPLTGTTVGSVRLEGPERTFVATARLGQVAGSRAVRLEKPTIEMVENSEPQQANLEPITPEREDPLSQEIEAKPLAAAEGG